MRKRAEIVLVLLAAAVSVAAKQSLPRTVIRTWQMPSLSAVADTIAFSDTAMLNYHDVDVQQRYSLSSATNGNVLVSPIESRIVQDRLRTIDDPFAWSFAPYVTTPQQQRYFNSTTPFSTVAYKKGFVVGHEENDINFLFTGNIGKPLNLGVEMDYLNSAGHYTNTAGKLYRGSLWGSYNGNHYTMHAAFGWSKLSSFDNGGLLDTTDMHGPLKAADMPVRLNAMTGYRYLSGYLHNQYAITMERDYHDTIEVVEDGKRVKKDTIKTAYVPLMTFSHIFEVNNSNRRYIEQKADQRYPVGGNTYKSFYDTIYYDNKETSDTTDVLTIRNTIAVTFCEEFNSKLKFGISAFVMNECQRFLRDSAQYNTTLLNYQWLDRIDKGGSEIMQTVRDTTPLHWINNTFVGGAIHKKSGKYIHYNVEGKVCLLGYKIWEYDVNGKITGLIPAGNNTLYVSARAYAKSETPSPYLQCYRSNHIRWDNAFGFTHRFMGGATVDYPTKWVRPRLDFSFENQRDPIYVSAKDWKPVQYKGNVQIYTADLGVDVTTPWINLETRAVYQYTSNDSVMPVPMFILQGRLYYHGTWFKALDAQIGADVRYFMKYKAPVLCPATGMFANQKDVEVGNYPWMNVYANFYVRSIHLRFFVQYQHLNHLFMKKNSDYKYLTMPGYPTNQDTFRAGLAWHFYN